MTTQFITDLFKFTKPVQNVELKIHGTKHIEQKMNLHYSKYSNYRLFTGLQQLRIQILVTFFVRQQLIFTFSVSTSKYGNSSAIQLKHVFFLFYQSMVTTYKKNSLKTKKNKETSTKISVPMMGFRFCCTSIWSTAYFNVEL